MPYTANICNASSTNILSTTPNVNSYSSITDAALQSLLTVSPVLASVDATDWSQYSGGVFSCSGEPSLNHAITVVGYD
jgi:C1A family cysteine protease